MCRWEEQFDKVCDKEIMTNNDNLESNLLNFQFIENTSGLHAGTRWTDWQQEYTILHFNLIMKWED